MVSKIIEYTAKHKFFVFVALTFVCVGAYFSMQHMAIDALPDLSETQVIIFTEWMGRSPDIVEDQITYPIASQMLSVAKAASVRGYSMFGMSFVYVIFEEGTDPYWARSRVLEYLNPIKEKLPPGVSPVLGPDATSLGWVFQYALIDKTGKKFYN